MQFRKRLIPLVALLALALSNCSGGGGSPTPTNPVQPWPKFRGDSGNTGQSSVRLAWDFGSVSPTPLQVRVYPSDQSEPLDPIFGSPAIGLDHTVYFATAGQDSGTVYALNPQTTSTAPLTLKWKLAECALPTPTPGTPTPGTPTPTATPIAFAPIRSSLAVTAVRPDLPATEDNDKVIFFGDDSGNFFSVQDQETEAVCKWVYRGDRSPIVSSPTFVIDPNDQVITSVFYGSQGGVFYALNAGNGSLKWKYEVPGGTNSAITASPLLDSGGPAYFPAADGNLYALDPSGRLIFRAPIGKVSSTFASSPARSTQIVVGTESGNVLAFLTSGILQWLFTSDCSKDCTSADCNCAISSVGVGLTGGPPATPPPLTPADTPTRGGSPTPTATNTPALPVLRNVIFAADAAGHVYVLDEHTGEKDSNVYFDMSHTATANIDATTMSSPVVSADGCVVFGDDLGRLNVLHFDNAPTATPSTPTPGTPTFTPTATATPATPPCKDRQLQLTDPATGLGIVSSPAVDTDGVVYIGGMDGRLYAIGTGTNP